MEPYLAKLAVYNSAGFLQRIITVLSNSFSSLLHSTTWLSFLLSVSLGCVAISTIYLWRTIRSNVTGNLVGSTDSPRSSKRLSFTELKMYQQEWQNVYLVSCEDIFNLWISSLNKQLISSKIIDAFQISSIVSKPDIHWEILRCYKATCGTTDAFMLTMAVNFPQSVLLCSSREICDISHLSSILLTINDFSCKLESRITHKCAKITSVQMRLFPDVVFSLCATVDHSAQQDLLTDVVRTALCNSEVQWTPMTQIPDFSTVNQSQQGDITVDASVVCEHSDRMAASLSSSTSDNEQSMNFPLRNASSMDATDSHQGRAEICERDKLFTFDMYDFDRPPITNGSLEALKGAHLQWKSCSLHNSESATPIILPYNAMIQKSMVERQMPKRHRSALVRSASYYGEPGSSRAHSTVESHGDSSPTMPLSPDEGFPAEIVATISSEKEDKTHSLPLSPVPLDVSSRGFFTGSPSEIDDPMQARFCKKLLVNVINADGLIFKGASTAYCVVELDEPYQRHTTHCASSVQLFWDQHLLFDLNTNSKRISIEIFELLKKKKSISKGRAEILLSTLTNRNGTCETSAGPYEKSDIRLRLPLTGRIPVVLSDALSISSSTHGDLSGVQTEPVVTIEFHFMEKALDEASGRRSQAIRSPPSIQRALSSRVGGAYSSSVQDSPLLHSAVTMLKGTTPTLPAVMPHSTSFDLSPNHAGRVVDIIAKAEVVGESIPLELSPIVSIKHSHPTRVVEDSLHTHSISQFCSPAYPRRNLVTRVKSSNYSTARPSSSSSLESMHTRNRSAEDIGSISDETISNPSKNLPLSPLVLSQSTTSDKAVTHVLPTTLTESTRSDHLVRRSNLIGFEGSGESPKRVLLPYAESDFHVTKEDSAGTDSSSAPSPRSQSLADRIRSSRLLGSSSLRPGKRSSVDSTAFGTNSLALLGPSRHLAGMVAGLSALPSDSVASPITAASLAAAVAVAGATGSWQKVHATEDGDSEDFAKSSAPHEPPKHDIPPAAFVAVGKPGTFAAINQPRRSDVSNLGLFRLFRQKKKRFRSLGAEKLHYLEHDNPGEFDAISTEGYYRIVHDNETLPRSPPNP